MQHVLVVDDDNSQCQLLQRTLHAAEIRAITLTDSREAIEIARKQPFDAIFVDVTMPSPDGLEVTRQIRSSGTNQKTPVIMITGHDDPSMMARGFQAGINFFLYKPIVKERLLNLVRVANSVNRVEKRRFHRVQILQKTKVRFNLETLEGTTINLSFNGMLARTPKTFAPGSHVRIQLDLLEGKGPLALTGLVIRVPTADSMGIHFANVGIAESKQLQDFLLPLMIKSDPQR
jgi:DNA-binding response OmpR family regulator